MTVTSNPTGTPCWTDLNSADPDGARKFYGGLLGWTFTEPNPEMAFYCQALKDGKPVAGLMPLMEGMTTSIWSLHIASDDANKTKQLITENGGTVMSGPDDVAGLGHMMICADPTGAVFGVWQAGTFAGAQTFNEPGALTWEDLRSKDVAKAREFYGAVFGYRYDDLPIPTGADFDYKMFSHADGERPLGGMSDMMGQPDEMPSHWEVYFRVEDTPQSVEYITSNGGHVLVPEMQTPFGRQCVVTDPFGGAFIIIDSYGAMNQQ